MANIVKQVAVVNATSDDTVLTDADARAATDALQKQVTQHFAPEWGIDATLTFVTRAVVPPPDMWWLTLLDNSDHANALGYHDLTAQGLPLGKVFVVSDKLDKVAWSVTASHELLEILGDPDINLWAFPHPNARADRLYAYETADACEADGLGYAIDGINVSDFLFPAWFQSFRRPGPTAQFDYTQKIAAPFQIAPGGYSLVYDIRSGTGYHQIFGDDSDAELAVIPRPRVGSRRERRMTQREHWRLSTAHQQCGTERWPVKTLADADAGRVAIGAPQLTTVRDLRALPRPFPLQQQGPQNGREAAEQVVYELTAMLVGVKYEDTDRDVHLVIGDEQDPTLTMIAEFPDPQCIDGVAAALVAQMATARDAVLAASPPLIRRLAAGGAMPADLVDAATGHPSLQPLQGKVRITGVAFFDREHNQGGRAPNVIELHPVLSFVPIV